MTHYNRNSGVSNTVARSSANKTLATHLFRILKTCTIASVFMLSACHGCHSHKPGMRFTYDFYHPTSVEIRVGDQTHNVKAAEVMPGFFSTHPSQPYLGRVVQRDDYRRVVVLSYQLWQRLYGADPTLIGRKVRIGDHLFQVIGVMPPSFEASSGVELWMFPFEMDLIAPSSAPWSGLLVPAFA